MTLEIIQFEDKTQSVYITGLKKTYDTWNYVKELKFDRSEKCISFKFLDFDVDSDPLYFYIEDFNFIVLKNRENYKNYHLQTTGTRDDAFKILDAIEDTKINMEFQ